MLVLLELSSPADNEIQWKLEVGYQSYKGKPMKMTAAESLRAGWKARGNPPCDHPEIVQEREERGAGTGDYVCTTCGAFVDPTRPKSK